MLGGIMKKNIKKIILIFIISITIICIKNTVQANSISSINMDIYVNNSGNAEVTETWTCYTNEGTECYHPYYNLGNSKITNLSVSDQTQTYSTQSYWDTEDSFSQKAYKCGINNIYNGVELCWGISNHGSNTYTVKYNISGFVAQLTDSQMMYWTLIPHDFSNTIGSVNIKIYSDKSYEYTTPVWGYGNYGGLCYVDKNDGAIHLSTDGKSLNKTEYITFLAQFPNETFSSNNLLDHEFEYYKKMADEGSTKYNKKQKNIFEIILGIISALFHIVPFFMIFIIAIIESTKKKYGFKYGAAKKKIPKDVAYYRDIPCEGDLFKAYYIAYQYDIMKNKTDILGAIILKWLKQGIIRTEQKEKGNIFKKEDTVIVLKDENLTGNENQTEIKDYFAKKIKNRKELDLFLMMYKASLDGILENKEFEKWCKKSYEKILDWFDDILREQRDALAEENLLIKEKGGVTGIKYVATPELKEEALKLAGLKKYLLEYTLIKERKAIEVELFEDYLIFAQILGIAKQVSKQFKELYPDMIEQTHYSSYDNIVYINYISSRGVSSASSAKAAAESYSSGGGGFSSGGGGGGSFGRRRRPEVVSVKKYRKETKQRC